MAAIEETLYLNSIPGIAESILAGGAEPRSECVAKTPWSGRMWHVEFSK